MFAITLTPKKPMQTAQIFTVHPDGDGVVRLHSMPVEVTAKQVRLPKRLRAWGHARVLPKTSVHFTPEAALAHWRALCDAQIANAEAALAKASELAAAPIEGVNLR